MLDQIYSRLSATGAFSAIEVAENLAVIVGRAPAAEDGTLFIAPWREHAQPSINATGVHRQHVSVQFVTAILFRRYDDPRGGERARAFEAAKGTVEQALVGWIPDGAFDVVSLVGAEASSLGNGVSIYAQTWQTSRFLTGALT